VDASVKAGLSLSMTERKMDVDIDAEVPGKKSKSPKTPKFGKKKSQVGFQNRY